MYENRKVGFVVAAENQTKQTFEEIKRDAADMAGKVEQAGKRAGSGVEAIGDGAERAAAKFSRGESALIASMRRATEEINATVKASGRLSDAFSLKIDSRGFDAARLDPFVQKLRDAESALSVMKAREAEIAAQNAFAKKHQEATLLAQSTSKAAEYAGWWAQELKKVEAAERQISSQDAFVNSLKAQADAIGKTRADLLEMQAAQMGVSSQAAPYIAKLRETERGIAGIGMSAGQTRMALQQLPMQFQDIVVSLQAGQAPMTVLLQQGSQLAGSFGGVGAAAKAMAGYVFGLVNPLTLAGAAAAALAVAYYQGSKENDAFVRSIVTTGNASGVTTSQLRDYARAIDGVIGTQAQAAAGLADFVSAGVRGGDELRRYTQTAIEWEKATGQAVSKTAEQFASLQKDPLTSVLKLNEGTNFLTMSVYEQIKALTEQGRSADASRAAMDALDGAMRERSKAIEQNLGSIERGWRGIKGAAKEAWDAMLNVGRASTIGDQLSKAQAELDRRLNEPLAVDNPAMRASREKGIERLRAEIWALQEKANAEDIAAAAAKQHNEQLQARIAWDKAGEAFLSKSVQMERELAKAREEGKAAGASAAAIEERLAGIRDKYKDKGAAASESARNKDLREQQRIYAELADVSSTYYNDLAAAQEQRAKGKIGEAEYVKYVEELIQKQPFAVAAAKAHAEAIKDEAKAAAASAKTLSAWYEVREKESQGLQNQINARREDVMLMGMSAEAVAEYTQAKYEQLAAEKEAYAAALESASFYAGEYAEAYKAAAEAARQQAKQLRELGALGVEKVSKGAAKKAADEWQRTADDINRALTDSLMRGFESGKDMARNLRDTVVSMFKTMVLRPIISAIVMPFAGAITGALGLAGSASAGQGGVLSTMGNAGGILSGASAMGGAVAAGAGWMTGATTFGGALSAGGSLVAAGGAGVLPGMGMIAGALAPIGVGLAGLYSLYKSLDRSGTPHWGAAAEYDGTTLTGGNDVFRRSGTAGTYSAQAQAGVDAVAKGVGDTLNGLARAFGRDGGYSVMTAYSDDSSDDPGFGSLRITRDGQKIRDWEDDRYSKWAPGIFADGEEGWKLYLSAIAKDTRQALQDMDIPGWADKMLSDLGDTVTMEQLAAVVQQIGVINTAFEQLGNHMSMFAGITDELQGALLEAAGGIDALVNSAGAFYQGFYSEAERMESMRDQLNAALSGLDLSIDPNLGDDAKAQFRAAVESAMAAGNAELAAALLAISGNFATAADYFEQLSQTAADAAKKAAEKAAQDADKARKDQINSVYDMFRRAVERDRSTLSDQASALGDVINSISSAVDLLKSNARDLYGEVDGTQQMLAAQGMVYIEDALAGVRAGASVADYTGLSDAISAARGGLSSGAYASEFDRQRDTLVLAGQLSELAEAGGEQLSVQERQLRGINAQIDYLDTLAKRADDMVNGTAALTGTVESYFNQLMSLLGVKGSTSAPSTPNTEYGGVQGGTAAKPWQYGQGYAGEPTRFGVEYDFGAGLGGRGWHDVTDREQIAKLTGLRSMLQAEYGSGSAEDLARVADKAKAMGATMGDIASALGFWREDIVQMFAGVGIPAFAVGTNYVPRDMVAKIHEGEAIVPKAFNPWAGGGGMQINTARLEALVEKLTEENQRQAGEIVRLNLRVAKVLERWDGDGMPTAREEAKA